MNNVRCPKCSKELRKRYYKHYGWALILIVVIFFPIKLFFFKTITPLIDLICVIVGLFLILKRKRYFYFCKNCVLKLSEEELDKTLERP
jgi:cobalamin biosynthesis protein CobD/CbiB